MTDECPGMIPIPKSVKMSDGDMSVGRRVVATQPELGPLAVVVADEVCSLIGRAMTVAEPRSRPVVSAK